MSSRQRLKTLRGFTVKRVQRTNKTHTHPHTHTSVMPEPAPECSLCGFRGGICCVTIWGKFSAATTMNKMCHKHRTWKQPQPGHETPTSLPPRSDLTISLRSALTVYWRKTLSGCANLLLCLRAPASTKAPRSVLHIHQASARLSTSVILHQRQGPRHDTFNKVKVDTVLAEWLPSFPSSVSGGQKISIANLIRHNTFNQQAANGKEKIKSTHKYRWRCHQKSAATTVLALNDKWGKRSH